PARHFGGAERLQMVGDELRIEQDEATRFQPGHQMDERDLGGVARPMEHAFPEEGAAETDAIESAHEFGPVIDLDGMAVTDPIEPAIEIADAPVDAGASAPGLRFRSAVDHRLE